MANTSLKGWVPYRPELAKLYEKRGYWKEETFAQVFDQVASRFWDREALIGGEQRFTYGELKDGSDRLAMHFLKMGLKHGDTVVVQLINIPEFVFIYLAMQKIGVIPVMCLSQHRYTEISEIAAKAEAVGYIVPGVANKFDYTQLVDEIADALPSIKFKMIAGLNQKIPEGYIYINDLLKDEVEKRESLEILDMARPDPHDVCILLLSGGTTGIPKLIPREYNAYRYVAEESSRELGYNMYTVQLAVAPVAHNMVLAAPGIQGCFSYGGKVVMSTSAKTEDICKLIEKERITHIPMVPAMIIGMLNFEDRNKYDLSSWEIVINGGSKIEPTVAARVEPELKCRLISQFGMSEGTITQTSLFDDEEIRYTTIGLPVSPDDEWKIVDSEGKEVAPGETGEILFRGPYTIRGYFRAEEHNAKAFTADGFFHSGDLASMHPSGKGFIIQGRVKDLINRGGEKINCEEVENMILKHDKVHDAALVPMPDPILGERACVFVSLRDPKDTLTLEELKVFLTGKMAKFKFPERLEIRDELPQTNVGKIKKTDLKAEIEEIVKQESAALADA